MKQKIYQVDAFTNTVFSGNPAAVCILDTWLEEETMQKIASENNLSETAFAVKKGNTYEIRWFTPIVEIDLCGHATLATAYVLFNHYGVENAVIEFYSHRSGPLFVKNEGNGHLVMDFPSYPLKEVEKNTDLYEALGATPIATFKTQFDYFLVFPSEEVVQNLQPNFSALSKLKVRGIIVTAKGNTVDFVSRFFAPASGIDEDPVTGSAHCALTPYWSKELNKKNLIAKQISERGGDLICEYLGERVKIGGQGVLYLVGEIEL